MIIQRDQFSTWIESSRAETKESYMDTVILGCERFQVEVELVQTLLSEQIIMKIKAEAIKKRYFKSSTKSLKAFL